MTAAVLARGGGSRRGNTNELSGGRDLCASKSLHWSGRVAGERIRAAAYRGGRGMLFGRIAGAARYAPVRPVRGQMVAMRSERVEIGTCDSQREGLHRAARGRKIRRGQHALKMLDSRSA